MEKQTSLMCMDFQFNLLGELPAPASLTVKREFWGVGSFKLTLDRGGEGFGLLARDRVLYPPDRPELALLITKVSRAGRKLTADGTLLKGLARRRIVLPPLVTGQEYNGFGYDLFTGPAESAYLHYAAHNLAAPEDDRRRVPGLVLSQDRGRGLSLPWQARFDRLSDLFEDIGQATGLGWDIRPDHAAKRYVFEACEGVDRTSGTGRCALSERMGNAGEATVTEDATAAVTVVYAGGAGEDEQRLILSFGGEHAGLDRYEAFEDCGSIDEADMLAMAADRKLADPRRTMTLTVLDGGLCRYGRDYDVGDVVTAIGGGFRMDARLLAMEEGWEGGRRTLKATFGDAPVTAAHLMRRDRRRPVR